MDRNLIIYISLIIICIIIFTIFFYNNFEKRMKRVLNQNNYDKGSREEEKFFPWDFDKNSENKPNFVKKYENGNFTPPPNYRYENITQYNFQQLFTNLEKINKEKIVLKNKSNYNFYTQSTTQDKLRLDLDHISKYVVLMLNSDNYYNFSKTNYGDVELWTDNIGNEELKYELFLWDKKNYFEVKLLIHIIKFVEKGQALSYGVKDSPYIFPDYNIGMDFKDQIIPGPLDTIITAHMDTGINSIHNNSPSKIKLLYLNQIEVQNSTLIVDYHKNMYPDKEYKVTETGFSGITDSTLEYINIKKSDHNPYLEKGRKYNQWPTLDSEPKWMGQYPSKNPDLNWDDDGVYCKNPPNKTKDSIKFTKLQDKENDGHRYCDLYEPGTRWSEDREPLQGQYYPNNFTVFNNCGENSWLFERQNPSSSTFYGGGKK